MTFAQAFCGAALLASTAAGAAERAFPNKPKGPAIGRVSSSVRLEYTDFSKLFGDRAVLTADSKLGIGRATRVSFSLAEGQRRGVSSRSRGTQAVAAIDHSWSDRLSSRSSIGLASNGAIFAKEQFGQDISYKITDGLVGTIGGRYSSYGNRNDVATWSAGAAYYARGAMFSYRYSLLASSRFGRSYAHLASFRVKDPGGSGSSQLWVGHGTSLYEVDLPRSANGTFTSIALQRSQPIGGGVALDVGVNRAWYKTPTAKYRGTGLVAGLSFSSWPH
jgi:YaiO family outer membrane protein